MERCFRYRINPTCAQERMLLSWLEITRELYNAGLQERREAWKRREQRTSLFDQIRQIPAIREARPDVAVVPTVVLRGALGRLQRTFENFIRRSSAGEGKSGYPRFKDARRFKSLLIDDLSKGAGYPGKIVAGGSRIWIPRVGKIKIRLHRPVEGVPKMLRLVLENGIWFVSFYCTEVAKKILPKTGRAVGIDLGLAIFAATSDSGVFENPKPLRTAKLQIDRAHRKMTKQKRDGERRERTRFMLAKLHARAARLRRENHIRVARALVKEYDDIFVEDLTIQGLASGPLAKEFRDAGFGLFIKWLRAKAEEAGRSVEEVNPSFTSQTCPDCGHIEKKSLKQRMHRCACGLNLNRDIAAARVILALGTSARRDAVWISTRQRPAKIKSTKRRKTTPVDDGAI